MINEVLRRDKKEEMCLIKKQLTIFQKVKSLDSGRLMVHKQKKKKNRLYIDTSWANCRKSKIQRT